ncbi:unnamed protein product [Urochloa decumbens]|uniref:RRM domain-containing protein n=1 Tax=Urochloa decumbens TaxID=240449 RepID=A0ABC9APD7_9POAL
MATADAAAPSWPDLPFDLTRDVSSRLHAATDYVRFHAACQPWRDTLPPAASRPAFLPWLLSTRHANGLRKARCVFSSNSSRRASAATEILVRDRRWLISAADGGGGGGASACLVSTACPEPKITLAADPLTGPGAPAIPLPRFEEDEMRSWEKRAVGVVSGDGTIIVYAYGPVNTRTFSGDSFHAALLRPGDAAWTFVQRNDVSMFYGWDRCCVSYRGGGGRIVLCYKDYWWILPAQAGGSAIVGGGGRRSRQLPDEPGKRFESSYLVESRGELLWVFVLVDRAYYADLPEHGVGVLESLTGALSVSVYMLEEEEGRQPEWVKKDEMSMADRVMFLGRPCSFAIDSDQVGFSTGCAYFVEMRRVYGGIWSKSPLERCRLFRYSFRDGKSELVEQLPEGWNDENCMWLTPQPALAPTEEIRERVEALNPKSAGPHGQFGTYFRIYVGNLPRKVDSYQLRQFFSKHGKVADARVMCHKGTGRSRGFGFVTMATHVDNEPVNAIVRLHGQSLYGRTLRVKLADQEDGGNSEAVSV